MKLLKERIGKIVLVALTLSLIVTLGAGVLAPAPVAARLAPPGNQYDRQAVVNETWYAMSENPYACPTTYYRGYMVGSWNYMASDKVAQEVVAGIFQGNAGWTAYPAENAQKYGLYQGLGRGGQCLFFANLILYRSGAIPNNQLPTSWTKVESSWRSIDYAKPGDMVFKPRSTGTPHAVIVVYRSGNTIGLIESNWVDANPTATPPDPKTGKSGGEIISYRTTTITNLKNAGYRVYTGVDYYQY